MRRIPLAALAAALAVTAPAEGHGTHQPTLEARAILPNQTTAPAPFPAVANADPAPAPGSTQPVGGFSALLAAGHGSYWAMTDNGFGSKANSRSFILRLYRVRPDWRHGDVDVLGAISLRDPRHRIPFPIVNEHTADRLLTGGDLDIESVRRAPDGTLWFGEELGPFIVHTDATGAVLEAPIPTPGVQSPDSPYLGSGTPNLNRSSGFEGMAISADGRHLYPFLEGPVAGDDPRIRRVFEVDIRRHAFTGRTWAWRMTDPAHSVSDVTLLRGDRFVVLERDNGQGAAATWKRAFVTRIGRSAAELPRRQALDLLDVRDPRGISLRGARPGDLGIGDPFAFPYQTVEAVLPVGRDRLTIVNDTNITGSHGRNPARDDDSDFIEVRVPGLRR